MMAAKFLLNGSLFVLLCSYNVEKQEYSSHLIRWIWLHRMTDDIPQNASETQENVTGTSSAYVAYNTTVNKIESWTGPQPSAQK